MNDLNILLLRVRFLYDKNSLLLSLLFGKKVSKILSSSEALLGPLAAGSKHLACNSASIKIGFQKKD
jgi:hypothetical protein